MNYHNGASMAQHTSNIDQNLNKGGYASGLAAHDSTLKSAQSHLSRAGASIIGFGNSRAISNANDSMMNASPYPNQTPMNQSMINSKTPYNVDQSIAHAVALPMPGGPGEYQDEIMEID